jgi:hypothetical protein
MGAGIAHDVDQGFVTGVLQRSILVAAQRPKRL